LWPLENINGNVAGEMYQCQRNQLINGWRKLAKRMAGVAGGKQLALQLAGGGSNQWRRNLWQ